MSERAKEALDLEFDDRDFGLITIRGYMKALLHELWREEDGFSGKRPFGNSGWQYSMELGLIGKGILPGSVVMEDGYPEATGNDLRAFDEFIHDIIEEL